MSNLRELFEKVRNEVEHRPAISITRLPENTYFKVIGMEKRTTIYGDRVLVQLDHTCDVWLTEFWSRKLDGETLKRLAGEGHWMMAYVGLKRIGQYSRADINIVEDADNGDVNRIHQSAHAPIQLATTAASLASPPPASSAPDQPQKPHPGPSRLPTAPAVIPGQQGTTPEEDHEDDIILLEVPPPPPNQKKRNKRGATQADSTAPPPTPQKRRYASKGDVDVMDHPSYDSLFSQTFE